MTRWTLIAGLSLVLLCGSTAMAARCSGVDGIVFCDDFDRWCEDPPEDPDAQCPDGDPEDEPAFWAYWPRRGGACSQGAQHYRLWTLGDKVYYKYASAKAPQSPDTQRMPRHFHDMTTEIADNLLNTEGYGAVNGSGEILSSSDPGYVDPDTIGTVLKGHTFIWTNTPCASYSNFTYYTELNLDRDRAPTNFIWRNCFAETQDHGGGPHQLMAATDVNPDPGTDWHHASFAFGLVAHFDDESGNPCDVDTGRKPTAWRAFVYDGANWTRLKFPAFDLPDGNADFYPWKKWNRLRFWIGTDHIEIRLYNPRATVLNSSEGLCGHQGCGTKCMGGVDHGTGGSDGEDCASDTDCAPSSPGSCVSGTCPDLGCDIGICDTGGICVGGLYDGEAHACTDDADCPDSCEGGPNEGLVCTTDADCPKSCKRGWNEGSLCDTDDDCTPLACWGGSNHRNTCNIDDDCPAAPPTIAQPYFVARVPRMYKGPFNTIALGAGRGVDQMMTPLCEQIRSGGLTKCVGGINNGNTCTTVADCPPSVGTCVSGFCDGGMNDGGACTSTCPDGVCNAQAECDGGANAGEPCDCPASEECLKPVSNAANDMALDEVILWDGVFELHPGALGACCKQDDWGSGHCVDMTEEEALTQCNEPNDDWKGVGIRCSSDPCEFCPDPFADTDRDTDVDQDDFGKFQACITGLGGGVPVGCECFNQDTAANEPDIDEDDYAVFEACASGPDVPADPSCDGPAP